jgi:hypothetical protein
MTSCFSKELDSTKELRMLHNSVTSQMHVVQEFCSGDDKPPQRMQFIRFFKARTLSILRDFANRFA